MQRGHHGQTPAAWTASVVVMVAFLIGTLAVVLEIWWLFWVGGVGLLIVGGILGKVMSMMGYGIPQDAHQT